MKNRVLTFLSILFVSTMFLSSCQNDDNDTETQTPVNEVTTAKQFADIEEANDQINSLAEEVFNAESGFISPFSFKNKMPDCIVISSESAEGTRTILIDFGDACEVNGQIISGRIRMSFSVQLDSENKVEISYDLENFVYKDITVNGSATSTFIFRSEGTNTSFATNSNFSFAWGDGLTATSETNFANETFFESNPDTPGDFEYYTLNSGSSSTEFSNGDKYAVEITTPLRNERGCDYTVSGVITTTENSESNTIDYGNGECDNIATLTDNDGNETTLEL